MIPSIAAIFSVGLVHDGHGASKQQRAAAVPLLWPCEKSVGSVFFIIYPLVKIPKTMENHHLYPLVNFHITMERSTIFNGKTHELNGHFQ